MANVQPEHGYTKIADEILEQMARIKLSPTQYRILFIVWRFTYGFNRKEHDLTLGFISNATGCEKRQLQRELKGLEQRKIIFQKVINGVGRKIKFNKNHDEWVGKTAIGEITIGETDNGETANPSIGETDNGTIGETDNQDIHSLNTTLNTVSQLEELTESEILDLAVEVEKHYCEKRGILDCSTIDFHEIKILVSSKIPVDFIKSSLDRTFLEYKPKYPKDQIRSFSYCATACYDRWDKATKRNQPVEPNNVRQINTNHKNSKQSKPNIPIIQTDATESSRPTPEEYEKMMELAKRLDARFNGTG